MLSIIVPAYNAEKTIGRLLDSLLNQTYEDYEIIVVDDCSKDNTANIIQSYRCNLIKLTENHGPAYSRNIGAKRARGDVLVFADSDCKVASNWLENIHKHFSRNDTDAVMGRLVLLPSTFLGDSISCLGFPAGGAIGFDKIWKVDEKGFTNSFSTCNCAIRSDVFWETGGFDETFPYAGGEDVFLAYTLRRSNYRIKYCSDVLAYHPARDSFRDFISWQFKRGISSYIFSKKVLNKKDFVSLRAWSTKNIINHYYKDKKFPLILILLLISFITQITGYMLKFIKESR